MPSPDHGQVSVLSAQKRLQLSAGRPRLFEGVDSQHVAEEILKPNGTDGLRRSGELYLHSEISGQERA